VGGTNSTNNPKNANKIYEEVLKQAEEKLKMATSKNSKNPKPLESRGNTSIQKNSSNSKVVNQKNQPGTIKKANQLNTDSKNHCESSNKKVNQSAMIRQMSPAITSTKKFNSRKVSPSSTARNSPKAQFTRKKSPSKNMLSEQIENICQVLECLNQQEKGKATGSGMNEGINRMLRELLKTELRKLGKEETRSGGLPGSKERKNSIANIEENCDNSEKEIHKITAAEVSIINAEKVRHRTPSGNRRDQNKPAINVSINHNVGNLCYAPVFIGHNRSASKDIKNDSSHPIEQVQSNIKTGMNIINPKPSTGIIIQNL